MEKIWLKNYPEGVPHTIDVHPYQNLADFFHAHVQEFGDSAVYCSFGREISYRKLEKLSGQMACYLQKYCGISKGDRVAVMLPNLLQYPVTMFAILQIGAVVVNVNPLYTAKELAHQLSDAGAKAIIAIANYADALAQALPDTQIEHTIITEVGDLLGGFKKILINFGVKHIKHLVPQFYIANAVSFNRALTLGSRGLVQAVDISGEDLAFLQYTGGTTGVSKGAMLTHHNIIANISQCMSWVKSATRSGNDIVLAALPLYHIFSLTICCLCFFASGSTCLLIVNPRDIPSFIKTLAKYPVSIFVGLNTLFNVLMLQPNIKDADFSKLSLTIAGGMATQKSVSDKWQALTGKPIIDGYGLTEASPVLSINPLGTKEFSGSIGLPIPNTEVEIRNEQKQAVAIGEIGELWARGPQVMAGYWKREQETREVIDQQGWLDTGDIARFDERGFLYLVDRKKDMILVSGFNVFPGEVEEVLSSHPHIVEAAVIGVPSERTGEAVKAFVVRNDPSLTEDDIINYCRQSLTRYRVPKIIEFRDELPKSTVGKVLRRVLRDQEQY